MNWLSRFGKNKAEKIHVRALPGAAIAIKVGTSIFTVTTNRLVELSVSDSQGEFVLTGRYRNEAGTVQPEAPLARLPNRQTAEECLNLLYNALSLSKWRWVKRGAYAAGVLFVLSLFNTAPALPAYVAQAAPHDLNPQLAVPTGVEPSASPWASPPVAENGYVFRPNVQSPKVAVPTLNCDAPSSK